MSSLLSYRYGKLSFDCLKASNFRSEKPMEVQRSLWTFEGNAALLTQTPCTCSQVFLKTEIFFSEYGYHPHVTGIFGHQNQRFSNTLFRVDSFENGSDLSYSCGWAKTEVFKYDDVVSRFQAPSSYIRFKNVMCGHRFF